jgi:hypothetical protein
LLFGQTIELSGPTSLFYVVQRRCSMKNDVARPGNVVFWCESAFLLHWLALRGGVAFDAGSQASPAGKPAARLLVEGEGGAAALIRAVWNASSLQRWFGAEMDRRGDV